jgi:hypothetical protein
MFGSTMGEAGERGTVSWRREPTCGSDGVLVARGFLAVITKAPLHMWLQKYKSCADRMPFEEEPLRLLQSDSEAALFYFSVQNISLHTPLALVREPRARTTARPASSRRDRESPRRLSHCLLVTPSPRRPGLAEGQTGEHGCRKNARGESRAVPKRQRRRPPRRRRLQ